MAEELIDLNEDKDRDRELHEIKELTVENNKMLHSIQLRAKIGIVWKILYWVVLIGSAIGAFYFIQPYYESLQDAYSDVKETQQKFTDLPQSFSWDSLKEYFTGSSTDAN